MKKTLGFAPKKSAKLKSKKSRPTRVVGQLEPVAESTPERMGNGVNAPASESVDDWIELTPKGISITSNVGRPVLVLKDQRGIDVLPVWMSPLDAGITVSELTSTTGLSPHLVTKKMMEALKIQPTVCSFVELVGHHQYVVIEFDGAHDLKALRVRADEAMSFCVQSRVKFRATRAFMMRCRDVDAELEKLEQGLAQGNLQSHPMSAENISKKHPYVI